MNPDTGTYKTNIDPYKQALYLSAFKLQYDLDFRFSSARRRIKLLKNQYKGKCVILCNGPSLNSVNFELLKASNVFTIGLNKVNLLFDRTDYRPDIICAVNPFVIEQNVDFFLTTEIPLFLDYVALKMADKLGEASKRGNIQVLHSADLLGQFSTDILKSVCQGFTVTYVALQVAFYLGFTEVALVGCDHNFGTKGFANKTIRQKATESNHFIKDYFPPGSQWQLPDLKGAEFHYSIARDIFDAFDRKVFNSTDGGKLEVFERMPLEDFLKK